MSTLHRGHIFHLTGRPKVQEALDALVEIPDGAILVNDDGVIESTQFVLSFRALLTLTSIFRR